MVDARITHAVVEVLRAGDPDARITHAVAEILRDGDPDARITHALAEVLRSQLEYSSNFGEYTSDALPSDWTERWDSSSNWQVKDITDGHVGNKVLRPVSIGSDRYGISCNTFPTDSNSDVELLGLFELGTLSAAWQAGLAARCSGSGSAESGYIVCMYGSNFILITYDGGDYHERATIPKSGTISDNDTVWIRMYVSGNTIKARIWLYGASEPGTWDIDYTESEHVQSSGWLGIWTSNRVSDSHYFSAIAGDVAPESYTTTSTTSSSTTTTSSSSTTTTTTNPPCWWDDDFTGDNGDPPDTNKWTRQEHNGTTKWVDIQSNKLRIKCSAGASPASPAARCLGGDIYSGDFDVQVDFELLTFPSTNKWTVGIWAIRPGATTWYYMMLRHYRSIYGGQAYCAWQYEGGSWLDSYSSTSDESGKLRIKRVGSNWYWYYWGGSSWTLLRGPQAGTSADVEIALWGESAATGYPAMDTRLDNFVVNQGCPPTTTTTTSSSTTTTTVPYPEAKVTKAAGFAVLTVPDGSVVSKATGYTVLQDITTSTSSTASTTSTFSTTSTTASTSSTSSTASTTSTASSSSTTTTPPPEYWHTDFRKYAVDVSPTGWTEKWHPTSGVPTIRNDGVIGTNCLEIVGADERYGLSWDVVGNQDDAEILAKVRVRANVDITAYLVIRGSGTGDADENAYYACLYNSSNLIAIRKYVAGSSLSITSDSFTIATDSWYWMRFRVIGSSLKLRVWADGDSEPGTWQLEDTDTDVSGVGWVGGGTFYNGPDYDFISVASNGGTALSPSGTTTTTTSSSTTTSTHTYTGSTTTESSTSSTSSTASTTSTTSSTASTTSTFSTTSSSSTTTTTTYPPCFWNDDFTGNDTDPPAPLKWQNDSTGIGTAAIASNKLQIHNGGGSGNLGAVSCRAVFSGDFETEVDIDGIITPFEDSWSARFQVYINATNYLWLDMHFESATDTWSVGYRKGGGEKYPDSVARVNDFGALKITRTGSIIRTYIDDGRTGSWTEINVGGQNVNSGDATVSFQVVSWEFEAPLTIDWDNFYVNYDGCPESVTSTTSSTTSSTTTTVTRSSTTTSTSTSTSTSSTTTSSSTSSSTASTTSTFSTTSSTASSTSTYSTTSSTASTTSTFSTTSTTETGWTSTSSTSSTASTTSTFSTTSTTETAPPPPDIASYTMVVVTTG